jgi:DNA-binding PadR family transcriptional regulator
MAQNIKNLGYIIKQPEDEHGKVYYTLLEEFEKASKERRAQIDEDVRKVLSKFNGIEKV